MLASSTLALLEEDLKVLREALLNLQKLSHAQSQLVQSAVSEDINNFAREKKNAGDRLQSIAGVINQKAAIIRDNGTVIEKKKLEELIQQTHLQCQPLLDDIERVETHDMSMIQSMRSDALAEVNNVIMAQGKLKVIRAGYNALDSQNPLMFDRQG
jgi:hypothetical protein